MKKLIRFALIIAVLLLLTAGCAVTAKSGQPGPPPTETAVPITHVETEEIPPGTDAAGLPGAACTEVTLPTPNAAATPTAVPSPAPTPTAEPPPTDTSSGRSNDPRISADGRFIAFTTTGAYYAFDNNLTVDDTCTVALSPDGRFVAYDNVQVFDQYIFSMRTSGGNPSDFAEITSSIHDNPCR